MQQPLLITRKEALEICESCSTLLIDIEKGIPNVRQKCPKYIIIERSTDEYITIPDCQNKLMTGFTGQPMKKNRSTYEKTGQPMKNNENNDRHRETETGQHDRHRETETGQHDRKKPVMVFEGTSLKWDDLNTKIIESILEGSDYQRAIQRYTDRSLSVIQERLDDMIEYKILQEWEDNLGNFEGGKKKKKYTITALFKDSIIYNEKFAQGYEGGMKKPESGDNDHRLTGQTQKPLGDFYENHSVTFKAEITKGEIPKGISYKPRGWTGELFSEENYEIRVIPKKGAIGTVFIDINIPLRGRKRDIDLKYYDIAKISLYNWKKRFNLELGQILYAKDPHHRILGSERLGRELREKYGDGELYFEKYGVKGDKSRSDNDVEFVDGDQAEALEYMLTEAPEVIDSIKSDLSVFMATQGYDISDIKTCMAAQRNDITDIKNDVKEILNNLNGKKALNQENGSTQNFIICPIIGRKIDCRITNCSYFSLCHSGTTEN